MLMIVFADTIQMLQLLMDRIVRVSSQYGLEINTAKTKLMVISKENITGVNLVINQRTIERVKQYPYLGTIINENWDNSQEVKFRIGKARSFFQKMSAVFKSHNLTLGTKIRLLHCYVYSVLLYGVETWTLNKNTEKKLEASELWLYRCILRIPWIKKVTNLEVMRRMNTTPQLIKIVKCRQLQYLGHIMRNTKRYDLLQKILQGKINSKRGPGRRRISWFDNILQLIECGR